MAVVAHADNKRMYSWWWDSHISPKNSKWLQENLTDMDAKVKQMIKVIEEDADSFARRAEMYYKKRPELMKLVEEFYRAYRALAERYDHATGVIRHAHRTMAEAFPNQVPAMFMDDSPAAEVEPRTPELAPARDMFEPNELQKDALGLSSHVKRNGMFTDESDTIPRRKGFKQLNDLIGSIELRARKGLNFHNVEESDDGDLKVRVPSESDRLSKAEMEIITLKNSLAKLEAEKEAGLIQYHQSLERLSNLEKEVVLAQEGSRGLHERASMAEAEVQNLKGALAKVEAEREASLAQYEQCLEKISHLENSNLQAQKDVGELNELASKAEIKAQSLKQELDLTKDEKEAALNQYMQCLEKISNLEARMLRSEEDAKGMKDRAERAEKEVETLKQAVAELINEKEAAAIQYQQCLEKIAGLEQQIITAEEEEGRLKTEILDGVAKLQDAEERCALLESSNQSLQSELESWIQKTTAQSHELTEKQKELGRLWASIQEERLRFVEAETAFQTLQHLHSQSQEDLRSLATDLQNRAQVIMAMDSHNQGLENELKKAKEENKSLNELNLSSEVSIKNLQEEIFNLRETIRKLEAEVELRVDQRNALQQEIYCLKEELNDLNNRHKEITEKVESVGLSPECFESSVMDLQEENVVLKDASQRDRDEKSALLEKLSTMEELIQKNALLENSLSDLNIELVSIREKVKALEDCGQSLSEEKSNLSVEKDTLLSQLHIANEISEKLSEKNNLLENSLFDANAELESVKAKLQSLENSCLLLADEKSNLVNEREGLASVLEISQRRLADTDNLCAGLKENCMSLEKQKNSAVEKVKDLQTSLDMAKEELTRFADSSAIQLATLESQVQTLEAENQRRKEEYEGLASELEISRKKLADTDNICAELRENCMILEKQEESAVEKVKDVENSLDMAKKELTRFIDSSAMKLATLESQVQTLEAENQRKEEEYEVELVRAETQIFILRECMQDLEEKNISLSVECRKLFECSTSSEKLITELQFENIKKHADVNSINVQIELLRIGLHQVLKIIDIATFNNNANKTEMDNMAEQDKRLLHHILARFSEIWSSLLQTQDKNHELAVENAVLIAFLAQLKEEVEGLVMEKHAVQQFLSIRSTQFLDIQNECQKLAELGEELRSKVTKGGCREVAMETEMQHLRLQLQELQMAYQTLLTDKSNMLHKNRSLGEEKILLEEENNVLLSEAVSHSNTCMIFKEIIAESLKGIEQLSGDLEKLSRLNCHLEDKVKNLEKQILKLSGEYNCQYKETESVRQTNLALESELVKLREELEETKHRKEEFHQEIKNTKSEVELWEKEAVLLFGELQVMSVHRNFLEGKAYELADAYKHLAKQSTSQALEIDQLNDRVNTLEGENEGLKAQLKAYAPSITSLNNNLASLESHSVLHTNVPKTENDEEKDVDPVSELSAVKHQQTTDDEMASIFDALSNLQAMPKRVEAVAKGVMEMERLAVFEKSNAATKLEAAMRQIEELKSGSSSRRDSFRAKKHANGKQEGYNDPNIQRSSQEIYEKNNEVTKDIMLDQISECSSYGISRRETAGNDPMLELWETTEYDGSINMKVGKANRKAVTVPSDFNQVEAVKNRKGKNPSTDSLVKDLGVDKLEISSRFKEPNEEASQRKILDRLDSDAQKLTNLQITVGDLKRKVDFTEKGKKVKGFEYGTVKEQLEEAEEAITKLFSANDKLITHIEDGSFSHEGILTTEPDEADGIRRRKIAEQARRLSEKIGRLQLEVQKIHFLLMKLNDEKESKGKLRIAERKTRVLLQDYLYGGGIRTGQRRKRSTFCSCVEPSTKGD